MDDIQTFELGDDTVSYSIEEKGDDGMEHAPTVAQQAAADLQNERDYQQQREKPAQRPDYKGPDASRHQELVLQACRFGESAVLGPYLSSLGFKLGSGAVKQMTIQELETALERIKVSVLNKGGNAFVQKAFLSCSKAVEVIVSKNIPACPLHGMTQALQQDSVCQDLLEYISITRNVGCSSPEMQIALCVASTVSRVVAINKMLAARAQATQEPEPPEPEPEEKKK